MEKEDKRYREMFQYVQKMLSGYDSNRAKTKKGIYYNRSHHVLRVYRWMLRLTEGMTTLRMDSLKIATIFHDIGYSQIDQAKEHAAVGADLCKEYLESKEYPEEQIAFICRLIREHSMKQGMFDEIPMELVILMEADLLDDTGAQGVLMDAWIEGTKEDASFESIREHMEQFSYRQMLVNPMRTDKGKELWEEKRRITQEFYDSYCEDLEFPDELIQ